MNRQLISCGVCLIRVNERGSEVRGSDRDEEGDEGDEYYRGCWRRMVLLLDQCIDIDGQAPIGPRRGFNSTAIIQSGDSTAIQGPIQQVESTLNLLPWGILQVQDPNIPVS